VTTWLLKVRVRTRFTLRLTIYRQSVHLGAKPLRDHDQLNPYATFSLSRGRVCLIWICLAFIKCTYRTYSMLLKILPFTLRTSSVSPGFAKLVMPVIRIHNGSLATWTVVSFKAAKFKPLSGFDLSYAANMFILMISYDFYLLPAQFCFTVIHIRQVESRLPKVKVTVGQSTESVRVRVRVTLRLDHQFILATSPLRVTTSNAFSNWTFAVIVLT
jgi:hypothetical protein